MSRRVRLAELPNIVGVKDGPQRSPGRAGRLVEAGDAGAAAVQGSEPEPIKHCLWRQGVIRSPECRLPLTRISAALAEELDRAVRAAAATAAA